MKFNQFAHYQVDFTTQLNELKQIGFTCLNEKLDADLKDLWFALIEQCFCKIQDKLDCQVYLSNILATPQMDAWQFYQDPQTELTPQVFYNVALQLLGFEVQTHFSLKNPFNFMRKAQVFFHDEINSTEKLINAWYHLLNTQTLNGQLWLDILAKEGFYKDFIGQASQPLFFNGKAQPIFDTANLIFEVVYVESDLDTDGDGKCDLLKAEIIRPKETQNGLKVPVIYTASPYNQGTNDDLGKKLTHDVNVKLTRKVPNQTTLTEVSAPAFKLPHATKKVPTQIATVASETFSRELSYTLNDYFLARGFAVVYAAGIGTRNSDGLRTCGSKEETLSTTAIIEWLTGKRVAYTTKNGTTQIKAWWSSQKVAMTGKSYLGTLAVAAATTGVEGLKTIISEAAISNWYDYYREGGLVVAPGGYPGEDADVLCAECFSRKKDAADFLRIKNIYTRRLKKITLNQDRQSGDYNAFWDARNYLKDLDKIKCDIFMVHGLNDLNVKLRHVYNLYQGLKQLPIKHKLILHQGRHIYINNIRSIDFTEMMNMWLSYKLYDVNNHATEVLPDVLVQDNTNPTTWQSFNDWQTPDSREKTWYLEPETLVSKPTKSNKQLSFNDQLSPSLFAKYQQDFSAWNHDLINDPALSTKRLCFKTSPLERDYYLTKEAIVSLKVATSSDHGLISCMLVDFGNAKRLNPTPQMLGRKARSLGYRWREDDLFEFTYGAPSDFCIIAKGHRNLQNRTNLWQHDELNPKTFYELSFALQPMFYHIPKGHQIGLIVYATDMELTLRGNEKIDYTLDLADCQLKLWAGK